MLRFKLIEKKDMSKDAGDGAKLFYPQLVSNGRVSFLINCLVRHLQEGRSVDCGDLGSFGITLRSAGAQSKEAYDVSTMMREPGVQYYLGKKLNIKYERITAEDGEQ